MQSLIDEKSGNRANGDKPKQNQRQDYGEGLGDTG